MWQKILGDSPISTIAGFLLAGFVVAQDLLQQGVTDWWRIGLAVGIAIFGRIAGDAKS